MLVDCYLKLRGDSFGGWPVPQPAPPVVVAIQNGYISYFSEAQISSFHSVLALMSCIIFSVKYLNDSV